MKKAFYILTVICLAAACGNLQFQSNERPEDKVIVLETRQGKAGFPAKDKPADVSKLQIMK
jgi:hypothetical protein